MAAVVKTEEEIMDYSEAAYVDSQYEYLQKHKSEGITLEELKRRRASQRWNKFLFSVDYFSPSQLGIEQYEFMKAVEC